VDAVTLVLVLIGAVLVAWGIRRMAKYGDTWAGVLLVVAGAWCLAWPWW